MKYYKLTQNAGKPRGFWGRMMIRNMNKNHYSVTGWGLERLDIKPTDTVLDVGCGGGRTVNRIAQTAERVCGIDYSQLAVDKSKRLNKKLIKSGRVEIKRASVSDLPYGDNTFDLITAVETYYFWSDKLNDLKEVLRVLKSRGTLLMVFEMCSDSSDPDRWKEVERIAGIKSVSKQEITEILQKAGYTNIKAYTVPENTWLAVTAKKG